MTNPKDGVGAKKAPLRFVPPALMIEVAPIMAEGARKYGPFNWREQPVSAITYVEAALRHLYAWLDGQDDAEDSELPHLAHAAASLGILLDAKANASLIDDRFIAGPAAAILRRLDQSAPPVEDVVVIKSDMPPSADVVEEWRAWLSRSRGNALIATPVHHGTDPVTWDISPAEMRHERLDNGECPLCGFPKDDHALDCLNYRD